MLRRHRTAHRRIWALLAILLPLALLGALAARRNGPVEAPAVKVPEATR
jgi:hypothetical protein